MNRLIVIEGPTASGKTNISVQLAKHFNTSVISADSRQFYKELNIGTAKPSESEQGGVVHYFIDSHSVMDEITAAEYEKMSLSVVSEGFKTNKNLILTGGSGMFIDALCLGLDPIPSSKKIRDVLHTEYVESGLASLQQELQLADPEYYSQADTSNPARVIRALEVIRLTKTKYSKFRQASPKKRSFEVVRFVLNHDRNKLYSRINSRVDSMMERGLLKEIENVIKYRDLSSLNTVGYKELFDHMDGLSSLEEAIEKIKLNTRRYAKRQLTWFRRHPDAIWIEYHDEKQVLDEIISHLNY